VSLSKREQAALDFAAQVRERTTNALLRYFFSHGVYVVRDDLTQAFVLEDHRDFLETLAKELDATTKAIRLAADIGSISLAEKEKAMRAVYEIEEKCGQHHGRRSQLQNEAATLLNIVRRWPRSPNFTATLVVGLLGSLLLLPSNISMGLTLLAVTVSHGAYRLFAFNRKKATLDGQLTEVNARFDSLVTAEVSQRPVPPSGPDYVYAKAIGVGVLLGGSAMTASLYHSSHGANEEAATHQVASASDSTTRTSTPGNAASGQGQGDSSQMTGKFGWMIGKPAFEVVNDRRFRAAFNHVSRDDWKKIAARFALTSSDGILLTDGYLVGKGCKAHACVSETAMFAINASTGKGDLIFRETVDYTTGKTVVRSFVWSDLPLESTPLAEWAKPDDAASDSVAETQDSVAPQASFDCTKARSDAQHLICSDAELAAADVELAALYAKAKAAATDQAAFKERTRTEWNYREQNCHDRECLSRWYADQKTVLLQLAETGHAGG